MTLRAIIARGEKSVQFSIFHLNLEILKLKRFMYQERLMPDEHEVKSGIAGYCRSGMDFLGWLYAKMISIYYFVLIQVMR